MNALMSINELKFKKDDLINLKCINYIKNCPLCRLPCFLGSCAKKHTNSMPIFKVLDIPVPMDQSGVNYDKGKG